MRKDSGIRQLNTPRRIKADLCVHELFERQVRRSPANTALRCNGLGCTYEELNRRANNLADRMRRDGIGKEELVGVCVEPSVDAIASILAVFKAGASYLPLDQNLPKVRLHQIIEEARPALLLTDSNAKECLRDSGVDVISVGEAVCFPEPQSFPPPTALKPDDVAYVSYTSGSTGRPKGIIGIHRSMTNGLDAPPFDLLDRRDICSLNSPLSYLFSLSRIFGPLVCGVPLVIISPFQYQQPETLVRILASERVTNVGFVTPLFREILAAGRALTGRLQYLRTISVGGAGLSPDAIDCCRALLPKVRLIERYAASEIGCPAFVWEFRFNGSKIDRVARPFPNTEIHILDTDGRPVSVGDVGELYVGATHLARGYLRHPSLTAKRFLEDGSTGKRLFRTGDLARRLERGDFRVLGRIDDQVKIRGFRVELGDVETAILAHVAVAEAAVSVEQLRGDIRLNAYVVPKTGAQLNPSDLRDHLEQHVPRHMIPATFSFLTALPQTTSGKVDRAQLPPPESARPEIEAPFVDPRDTIERSISEIWMDILGLNRVGVHDDFFELGGDSLLAVQVHMSIAETFDCEPSSASVFDHPTVAELAAALTREAHVSDSSHLITE